MSEEMNKTINNVKDTTSRLKEKWKNGSYKKILKRGGIVLVFLLIIGAGSAFALEKYELGQELKVRQAETKMIQAQAKLNNITLINEADVKTKVSEQIGVDASNITFDDISLSYLKDDRDNDAMTPVFEIECSANSVEYEAVMDAVSGSFYSVDVDD